MIIKKQNHINLQVKLKYAFKHYKIKKKKKADRKKALGKKKKGKKKKKKAVDPNDKLVKDTGDGQITINLDDDEDHEIGESGMFAKLDS
jgi:hypothetical protein